MLLSPPGVFDARSASENLAPGAHAWRQNIQVTPDGKLQTADGYVAFAPVTPSEINGVPCSERNDDYHNQYGVTIQADLEVPTLLYASVGNDGTRRLFMGTKTKLLVLDEVTGLWTLLADGYGADGVDTFTSVRFRCAQLQDNVFFTNNFDKIQYTELGSTTAQEVTDLQTAGESGSDAVAVTRAGVILKYQGVIMLFNTTEGGVRFGSRIRWSDLNDGLWWETGITNPNTDAISISDYQDLDYGQNILGAVELNGYLMVFTDVGIWRCSFTVDTASSPPSASLLCVQVYSEPRNKSKCLFYKNTLVSDGESIYYAGSDALWRFNLYMQFPERTDWIFKAATIVYQDGIQGQTIDQTSCESPVMEFHPDRDEIHFSWPVPDAEFIGEVSCEPEPPVLSSGINRFSLIINTQFNTCDYRDYGMACYTSFQSNISQTGQCGAASMFIGASTTDFCLKKHGVGNARIHYLFSEAAYIATGYSPIAILLFNFGDFDTDKEINKFAIDGHVPDTTTNQFVVRLGLANSAQQLNAVINGDASRCAFIWKKLLPQPIKCLMSQTAAEYAAKNIMPNLLHRWNFLYRAKFLGVWITVTKADGVSAPTSGPVVFTRLSVGAIEA